MATTYGYGGEFSSDEDVDKSEQQAEKNSKFDSEPSKPTRTQIESIIANIRTQANDEEIAIPDEVLVGILDYYRTPRGPIVDSTRKIYKKIILKQIRGEQQSEGATNDDQQPTNGNGTNGDLLKNGMFNNNNNEINLISNIQTALETPSSDEDEPMPPANQQPFRLKRLDIQNINNEDDKPQEPMEVDAESAPTVLGKATETIELNTTEDESDSETEESDSESEGLDMTTSDGDKPKTHVTSTPINYKVTPKRAELALKKSAIATKESAKKTFSTNVKTSEVVQTPFRRSQRVAATRLSKSPGSKGNQSVTSTGQVIDAVDTSSKRKGGVVKYIILAVLVALIAYSIHYFKNDILSSTQKVMRKAVFQTQQVD